MAAIPHPDLVLGTLTKGLKNAGSDVEVPREVLTRLLDLYISCWDFDEEWYTATYPDIQNAIREGHFASGWQHFRMVGYIEGRLGAQPAVDTDWYMQAYPDVAQAVLNNEVGSAVDHYVQFGYKEGRLPRDPGVYTRWYGPRYMPKGLQWTDEACTEHFIRIGYINLAVPAPPR